MTSANTARASDRNRCWCRGRAATCRGRTAGSCGSRPRAPGWPTPRRTTSSCPWTSDALRAALARAPLTSLCPRGTDGGARRPSIETFMHGVMPQRIVLHLHAIEALAVLVRADARETLRARLRNRFRWEWVEYRKPGAELARSVAVALGRTPDAEVVFLAEPRHPGRRRDDCRDRPAHREPHLGLEARGHFPRVRLAANSQVSRRIAHRLIGVCRH